MFQRGSPDANRPGGKHLWHEGSLLGEIVARISRLLLPSVCLLLLDLTGSDLVRSLWLAKRGNSLCLELARTRSP